MGASELGGEKSGRLRYIWCVGTDAGRVNIARWTAVPGGGKRLQREQNDRQSCYFLAGRPGAGPGRPTRRGVWLPALPMRRALARRGSLPHPWPTRNCQGAACPWLSHQILLVRCKQRIWDLLLLCLRLTLLFPLHKIASNYSKLDQLHLLLPNRILGPRVVLRNPRYITMVVFVGALSVPRVNRRTSMMLLMIPSGGMLWMKNFQRL